MFTTGQMRFLPVLSRFLVGFLPVSSGNLVNQRPLARDQSAKGSILMLSGWPAVLLISFTLIAATIAALSFAMRDWKHAIAIGVVSLLLMPLLMRTIFGDVSRVLPAGLFSDGPDGVGQIVITCTLCTVLGAVIFAAGIVGIASALFVKSEAK